MNAQILGSHLLREFHGVVALPACRFHLHGRGTQGLIWDPLLNDLVVSALPAVVSLPARSEIQLDAAELETQAGQASAQAPTVERSAVFGGSLLRHFGHFCHESLARLWWLGQGDPGSSLSHALCADLQALQPDVYFFMPTWLDDGKDVLPYMQQILAGLGLAPERIKIMVEPLRFTRLLVPAQAWGFDLDPHALDRHLNCDSKALMRSMFAGFRAPSGGSLAPAIQADHGGQAGRVFVSRTGLSLNLGRPIGDAWLDVVLGDSGFLIFRPEEHSIYQQIDVFEAARDLVFIDGSAMYLLWFAKLRPGARVSIILRRRQGVWMSNKVRALMPVSVPIHWRVIDEVIGEELTSGKDWESHNLLDLHAIARRILAVRQLKPSPQAEQALVGNLEALAAELRPEDLARILQVLIGRMVSPKPRRTAGLRTRLLQGFRSLVGRASRPGLSR